MSDGAGSWLLCRWRGGRELEPAGEISYEPRPLPTLSVGIAVTKGTRPEWAVQKLTEVGVDRMVLFQSARCVARWSPEGAAQRLTRLREVARQAAMQSRRVWLPSLEGPCGLAELLEREARAVSAGPAQCPEPPATSDGGLLRQGSYEAPALAAGSGVALAVPGGAPLSLATPTVLVGPEGGWTEDELGLVRAHVSLGPQVLRAETAAIAAGLLLVALRSGTVRPPAVAETGPPAGPRGRE